MLCWFGPVHFLPGNRHRPGVRRQLDGVDDRKRSANLGLRDQGGEHLAPRRAHDVGGDRRELAVGPLEDLLQAVDLGAAFAHQRRALAGQLAPRAVRDAAPPEQPVAEHVGDSRADAPIRLAARHGLDDAKRIPS
jgi:hypothetical protein